MRDSCRHVCKYTHTIYMYTVHTLSRTIMLRGGNGSDNTYNSDLLPWYYPENQHCSCDHVSLHPTGESRVSKEWKIEPSHISQTERHGVQSKGMEFTASLLSHLCPRGP